MMSRLIASAHDEYMGKKPKYVTPNHQDEQEQSGNAQKDKEADAPVWYGTDAEAAPSLPPHLHHSAPEHGKKHPVAGVEDTRRAWTNNDLGELFHVVSRSTGSCRGTPSPWVISSGRMRSGKLSLG